jgi:hypothetical protein
VVPHAQPQRLAEDAAEPAVADFAGRLLRFNAFSFDEDIIIDNARTPLWMVALLGVTEAAEGEENEPLLGNFMLRLHCTTWGWVSMRMVTFFPSQIIHHEKL